MIQYSCMILLAVLSGCFVPSRSEPINQQQAAELNVELGLAYLERGQVSLAKEKLNHAQQLDPTLSMTHYAMGHYWEKVGEPKKAEKEYKKAIQLNSSGEEHHQYGAFLCRTKQYHSAEQQFQKAIADLQYSQTAHVFENAGLCALQQQNVKKATYYLEQAILKDPKKAANLLKYLPTAV